jgi:hypothetical protein
MRCVRLSRIESRPGVPLSRSRMDVQPFLDPLPDAHVHHNHRIKGTEGYSEARRDYKIAEILMNQAREGIDIN